MHPAAAQSSLPKVVISVLNWNAAHATLRCLDALKQLLPCSAGCASVQVVVLDNGSREDDWAALRDGVDPRWVLLLRQQENLGFAGGHNLVIRRAMADAADYAWLLNNDAVVSPDTLSKLLQRMAADAACGAVSPVIFASHDETLVDFCGAMHDWRRLESVRPGTPEHAASLQSSFPQDMWVHGTAVLYRLSSLAEAGVFDEGMFAYYEDDDLGVRLSSLGWSSQVVFDTVIRHDRSAALLDERPSHFFYLMARNGFRFWLRHTARPHRRLIRLRLLSRSLLIAAKLRERGFPEKCNACLLGAWDGLRGRSGPPRLAEQAPRWLVLASFFFPYRLQKLLG
ncbi:MAG TPA: glycosyltransferase family 2 protein [Burkholderiaceae bacterium]|nr:glycosyltransferase family 2 protein [Burkholderiaceae bacterium]